MADNHLSTPYQYTFITRGHVLFTAAQTTAAALLFLIPGFPFPPGFLGVCIASALFHLILWVVFNRATPALFNVANIINLFMLALAVHYSGGILSPFTMVFVIVLISGAGYGVKMSWALAASVGFYWAVVFAEMYGYLPPVKLKAVDVYQSWPATLFVLLSITAFMLSSGMIYRVTVNNLREKISRELEIKNGMRAQLAQLEAPSQIGLLVHKIAHDLRGPLTSLGGFIQLLREENDLNEESQKDCDIFLQELGRINDLISRMLMFVKPGKTQREDLALADVLQTVLSVISFFPGAREVQFVTEFPVDGPVRVYANKQELQQVFFNVIKNSIEAFDAASSDRRIFVSVHSQNDRAVATIQDNGSGISEAVLSAVSTGGISTKAQGSGVGLVIVRDIIEGHGGSFALKSKVGEGTTVVTSLPLHTPTEYIGGQGSNGKAIGR